MKKEETFNQIEKKILRVLYQQRVPLTIYEIAKECGISYQTAKKYLIKIPKPILKKLEGVTVSKYMFNMDIFEEKSKKKKK